jgi:hypothetical protein
MNDILHELEKQTITLGTCKRCGRLRRIAVSEKMLCYSCYTLEKMKLPEYRAKARKRFKEKYHEDPEFRKKYIKKSTDWYKKNPEKNRERQIEYRKSHPDTFNLCMCRCFFRKLSSEQRIKLMKEFGMVQP